MKKVQSCHSLSHFFYLCCCMKQHVAEYIENELKNRYTFSEAKQLARIVLQEIAGLSATDFNFRKDTELSSTQWQKLKEIVERLKNFEPYQYILGKTEFFGLPFRVNTSVLIPRPETEELVEWMLSGMNNAAQKILDIGTGSGCIAIALAKNLPEASIWACDISREALTLAKENAGMNNVKVHLSQTDILQENPFRQKFDVIVSNPPYVTDLEKTEMQRNVLDFEPHQALFVPDDDALIFYQRIIEIAKTNLKKSGTIYFEINRNKGNEIAVLLKKNNFHPIEIRKDISGNPRMIRAFKK